MVTFAQGFPNGSSQLFHPKKTLPPARNLFSPAADRERRSADRSRAATGSVLFLADLVAHASGLTDDGDAHDAAAPVEGDTGRGFSVGVPGEDRYLHVAVVVEQGVCFGQEERACRAGRGDDVDGIGELVYLREADEVAQQEDALAVGVGETNTAHI